MREGADMKATAQERRGRRNDGSEIIVEKKTTVMKI